MPRVPFLFEATENIPYTPGSFLLPFLYRCELSPKMRICCSQLENVNL